MSVGGSGWPVAGRTASSTVGGWSGGFGSGPGLFGAHQFQVALGASEGGMAGTTGQWTLWGRADTTSLDGATDGGADIGGAVVSSWFGMDYRDGNFLVGLALSHAAGDLDVEEGGEETELVPTLTTFVPYVHWSLGEDTSLFALAGLGSGDLDINDGWVADAPMDMTMFAGGLRNTLRARGTVAINLRADAFGVGIDWDGNDRLSAVSASASRARLGIEFGRRVEVQTGSIFTSSFEVASRYDRGDADEGLGFEVVGSLGVVGSGGLSGEMRARHLVSHDASGFHESGIGLELAYEPCQCGGTGLSLSLAPMWGNARSGIDGLWQDQQARWGYGFGTRPGFAQRSASGWSPGELEFRGAFGFGASSRLFGPLVLAPFAEMQQLGEMGLNLRAGLRVQTMATPGGLPAHLEFFGMRREDLWGTTDNSVRALLRVAF